MKSACHKKDDNTQVEITTRTNSVNNAWQQKKTNTATSDFEAIKQALPNKQQYEQYFYSYK